MQKRSLNVIAVQVMTCKKNSQLSTGVVGPLEPQNPWTTARKARIYDCYGVLESIAWIWRVLGIFPLTIKGSMGMKKYEINKFYAIHSCLICFACNFNFIYGLSIWRKEDIHMVSINLVLRTFSSLLCLLVATIWRILRHNEISKSIEMIAAQESALEKMSCRLNYESNAKIVRAYVWTTTIGMIFLEAYDLYATNGTDLRLRIKWILWSMPLVIQTLDLTIFVSLVGLLGLKFRALNEKIKVVAIRVNASSPKVIITSNVCAENLRTIAKTHYNICAVGKRINSFFNWDVIINVITAFMILSTTLYYIFVEVQREGNTDYVRIGTYVQWELIHSIPIIVIVVTCNWTSYQGSHAGKLIHEIRVEKTDSRLYEAVKSFSLQLHHQNLEFNAGGFFPVNSTLLQTMVGNITTYLVILIQFQPKLD